VLRKVALVLVGGVFGAKLGPDMQVYLALVLVLAFIIGHLTAQPFDVLTKSHGVLHWLELGSLTVCFLTLYCGMLFWIGPPRIERSFLVFLSFAIIAGNVVFTLCILFVYCRAQVREAKSTGEHTAEALREQTMKRMRARLAGATRTKGRERRQRQVGRNGTIRGSLRYTAKVALRMSRAQSRMAAHAKTKDMQMEKMRADQIRARARLERRRASAMLRTASSLAAAAHGVGVHRHHGHKGAISDPSAQSEKGPETPKTATETMVSEKPMSETTSETVLQVAGDAAEDAAVHRARALCRGSKVLRPSNIRKLFKDGQERPRGLMRALLERIGVPGADADVAVASLMDGKDTIGAAAFVEWCQASELSTSSTSAK
jgi:hypothetical protein